jgi:hypothetical protein
MIKMLNAITGQIDDPDAAVAEILEQLDPARNLLKNSIGLVACNYEFIDVGTLEALEKALSFEIAGVTTMGNAAKGLCGQDYLSISVLTGDDVRFSSAITGGLTKENLEQEIRGAFDRAKDALGSSPDFILTYLPAASAMGGAALFRKIKHVCGDTPVFGSFPSDQTLDFHESKVIYNGKAYRDSLAFVFMEGDVHPRFFVTSVPERDIQKRRDTITESDGNILKKVNDLPVIDYLTGLGLVKDGAVILSSIPFIVNYNDGSKPVAVGMYGMTAEGYAHCAGDVPVGATLSIGMLDYDSIMKTAETMVSRFLDCKEDIHGILMYPCLTRSILLGMKGSDEMKKITGLLGNRLPYQLCYSGGEICPTEDAEGKLVNQRHNFTFIACVL